MLLFPLVVATLLAGCSSASVPVDGVPVATVSADEQDLLGTWRDADGRALPDGMSGSDGVLTVAASSGSTTCSEANGTVFLLLAWPPGRRLDWASSNDANDMYSYVRQTQGSGLKTDGPSDLDATLPAAARSTGLNKDGNLLYAITAEPAAIWVQRPDRRVERWARLGPGEGCA